MRLALRTLFKTPFVTVVAILSLALGVGANAAIFSLFNQMLLRPLPVPRPDQLVNLAAPGPKPGSNSCNQTGSCETVFSYPMFRDLEKVQNVFTGIAAHRLFGANLAARGQTLAGDGLMVSGSYFSVLGVQPAIGRLLGPADDATIGESHVVVLSHAYWRRQFGEDPGVLNQTLIVNGQAMTIVGVAAQGFDGATIGAKPEVFVPITMRGYMNPGFKAFDNRRAYWAYLCARLKPSVTVETARAALNTQYHAIINDVEAPLQKGLSDQTLSRFKAKPVLLEADPRGQSSVTREAGTPLRLLFSVTGLVLFIACANIANLLLARGAARASEMAVRLSLGASRGRLIWQLLGEACLLAVFGGIAGLVVAQWTLEGMASLLPSEVEKVITFRIDRSAMMFTGALSLATGLLFGLFPALHATRTDLVSAIKGQSGQPAGTRTAARFRTSLATAQIALSMALLVAAGLFTKSLLNVSRVQLGLKLDTVVTFRVNPELNGYTPERSRQFFHRLEDELAGLPGVTGVTVSTIPLLTGSNTTSSLVVEGFDAGPDTDTEASFNEIGPDYFATLGVPLIAGREFTAADALGSQKVAIVNEAFVRKFNMGRDVVGKHIGASNKLDTEIIGLVRDAKYSQVKDDVPPQFFRSYRQDERIGSASLYVRTSVPPSDFLSNIPKVVSRLDANLPVVGMRTMTEQVRLNVFLDRFISTLSTAFAVLATLLAAVGLYGVLAYTVAQRTREIGLRMALGASPARVRGMMLRRVGWMIVIGGIIGLAAAVGLGRLAQSLLYQLKGWDPVVLAGAAVALTLVALAAGFIPALRASRVDPMRAMRYE